MSSTPTLSVSDAIALRHSCRDFSSKQVSLDLIVDILKQARYAPSSGNLQPWKVYIVHGQTKQKLSNMIRTRIMNGTFGDFPLEFSIYPFTELSNPLNNSEFQKKAPKYYDRLAKIGQMVFSAKDIARNDMKGRLQHIIKNFEFFGAPIGLILTIDKTMELGQYPDLGIFLGNVMLLCQQYGLSTCAQVAWSFWHKTIRQTLNINDKELVFCGMSIGYSNQESKVNKIRTERMDFDEFVIINPKLSKL